jgi:GAF domain-containing protein
VAHEDETRARRLEAVDRMLPALFEALDVRDVFTRLSEIAQDVLPHDAVGLPLVTEDRDHIVPYASIGLSHAVTFDVLRIPDYVRTLFTDPWDFEVFRNLETDTHPHAGPYFDWGFRSAIRVPIQLKGRIEGLIVFLAHAAEVYSEGDVPVVKRIAMFVALALAHQRLAEQAQRAEALRERAANLEMLEDLLKTLSGVLDIRDVFDRVSDIAQKVLPHDAVIVIVLTGDDGTTQNYALRGFGDTPITVVGRVREPELLAEPWDFRIYDDLSTLEAYRDTIAVRAGMRGALLLPVRFEGRLRAFLSFMSCARSRFTKEDVLVGKRIADHVALAMSHHRLAEQARRNDELRARTEKVELLDEVLASVTGAGELPDVFGRVSNVTQKVLAHDCLVLTSVRPNGVNARVHASHERVRHSPAAASRAERRRAAAERGVSRRVRTQPRPAAVRHLA